MALPRPFETPKFTLYEGDKLRTQLAFAAEVRDSFTGEFPTSDMKVSIKEDNNLKPIKNTSGYYCFTDLEPDEYTVVVEPASAQKDWHRRREDTIDMQGAAFDPLNPVLEISLVPTPTYPFPGTATLIRGVVQTLTEKPVDEADVTATLSGTTLFETKTDKSGGYVIFFKQIPNAPIRIDIRKGSNHKFKPSVTVEEAKTVICNFLDFPET